MNKNGTGRNDGGTTPPPRGCYNHKDEHMFGGWQIAFLVQYSRNSVFFRNKSKNVTVSFFCCKRAKMLQQIISKVYSFVFLFPFAFFLSLNRSLISITLYEKSMKKHDGNPRENNVNFSQSSHSSRHFVP